jgi:hypothetical protein
MPQPDVRKEINGLSEANTKQHIWTKEREDASV